MVLILTRAQRLGSGPTLPDAFPSYLVPRIPGFQSESCATDVCGVIVFPSCLLRRGLQVLDCQAGSCCEEGDLLVNFFFSQGTWPMWLS